MKSDLDQDGGPKFSNLGSSESDLGIDDGPNRWNGKGRRRRSDAIDDGNALITMLNNATPFSTSKSGEN